MNGADLFCRDLLVRVAVVLLLSACAASAIAEPFIDVAMSADLIDTDDVACVAAADTASATNVARETSDQVPDFHFDDLRAERLASSHNWRVACVFEARGPPA
jgi:hypothetical protein